MEILILTLQIFFVRVFDVSLGTLRTMILVRGNRLYASLVGFFEILVWFLIVKEALNTTMDSIWIAVGYAGGFSVGTFLGSFVSSKVIKGTVSFQVITGFAYPNMVDMIRDNGYAVTVIEASGRDDKKHLLFIETSNKQINHLQALIKRCDEKAFIVVNDTKMVYNGFLVSK